MAKQPRRRNTERRQIGERLAKINECFLGFGADSNENINRLTALCGELLGATCALYNRLDQGMLCSSGQWHTPPDYNPVDKPEGHICHDVIRQGKDTPLIVRNLLQTPYAQTDPNVIPYQLQTYIGQAVKCGGAYVGSLCVVYQVDFAPSEEDKKLIGIIASAIGVEEERKRAEEELTKYRYHLEDLVEERTAELRTANEQLGREMTERKQLEHALRESEARYRELYAKAQRQSERLAQTLAISELLHRGLELEQVLKEIAAGVVELGFCRAGITVEQPGEDLLRVQAVAGLTEPEHEALMGATYRWSDYQALMQERFQVSRSYLIRHNEIDWEKDFRGVVVIAAGEDRGPGYWHPEDMLLVPFCASNGKPIGLISADEPADGLLPDMDTIRTLEAFANQAAIAIENARLYQERERLIVELQEALAKIKTLRGFIPICASCKKIRDEEGHWHQLEVYIRDHSEAEFSHGLCPDCAKRLYPEFYQDE